MIRLVANVVPTEMPRSLSSDSVLALPMMISVSASPLVSSSRFAALMFAVTAGPTAAVMLAAMVAATSPMAMGTAIPLTSIVPMTGAV